jgi:hypothetical protein
MSLIGLGMMLLACSSPSFAQPVANPYPDLDQREAPANSRPFAALTPDQKSTVKAAIAGAHSQAKTIGLTRQQIQAIRAALKAKLAMMHH